jgi:hypothetical protein
MNGTELTAADIAAVTRNNNGNCNGLFGGDGSWLAILFLFSMFGWGGYGLGGWGGFGMPFGMPFGNGNGNCATQSDVRAAVDQQTLIGKLDGITNGICDSTYAMTNAVNNGFHGVDLGLCGISREISDCCCRTGQAIGDLKYTVAQEACETRHAMSNNTRDIIDNQNANSRAILDFLVKDKIDTLTAENQSLKFAASQSAQNAFITANQEAQTAELVRRLGLDRQTCPIPAYVVPNPNCCYGNPVGVNYGYNNGCGCGCGN